MHKDERFSFRSLSVKILFFIDYFLDNEQGKHYNVQVCFVVGSNAKIA